MPIISKRDLCRQNLPLCILRFVSYGYVRLPETQPVPWCLSSLQKKVSWTMYLSYHILLLTPTPPSLSLTLKWFPFFIDTPWYIRGNASKHKLINFDSRTGAVWTTQRVNLLYYIPSASHPFLLSLSYDIHNLILANKRTTLGLFHTFIPTHWDLSESQPNKRKRALTSTWNAQH